MSEILLLASLNVSYFGTGLIFENCVNVKVVGLPQGPVSAVTDKFEFVFVVHQELFVGSDNGLPS